MAGYLYLPAMVTRRLPVAQIQRLGVADFSGRITRIGLRQTTAGPFVFGPADRPALAMGAIVLDYTPAGLRRKKIDRIRIRDVVINASVGPGGISFPGVNWRAVAKGETAAEASADGPSPLAAVQLGKLDVRSGLINLAWGSAFYKIPFDLVLTPDGEDMTGLDARLRLFPRGQALAVTVRVDVKQRKGRLRVDGDMIDMDRFADLVHRVPGLDATGRVSVRAAAGINLAPVSIGDAAIDLTWHDGGLACAPVRAGPERGGAPAVLSARSGNLKAWQVTAGGVRLQRPAPVSLNMLTATVDVDTDLRTVAGTADLTVLPFSLDRTTPVALTAGVPLPLTFAATHNASGEWTAQFQTNGSGPDTPAGLWTGMAGGIGIHGAPPRFRFTAAGDRQKGGADWTLDLSTIRAVLAGTLANLPSADAAGRLRFGDGPHGAAWSGDARIQFSEPTVTGRGMAGKLDALTVSARFQRQGSDPPVVDGRVEIAGGRFHHQDSGLRLSGVRLDVPYHSVAGKAVRAGTFSVARIDDGPRVLGNLQGRITRQADAYAFSATHASDLLPGMAVRFTGTVRTRGARLPSADVAFRMPPYELTVDRDLERLFPAGKGVSLTGTVAAKGNASFSPSGLRGDVDFSMKDGSLRVAEKNIVVTGIDAALRFPELPRLRSGPAQKVRFSSAAMGGIVVDGGEFDVQVESGQTLFLERGRMFWCGGKVDAGSLRVTAGKQDYRVSLYCQQLGLSRILEQLGSVNARGTGTVNGRIPVVYRNGNIRFDDGFLFSTPGEGGQVQLTGTEVLTRGIPAGTPQFAQVELAREALKNYAYTWAKLGLMSEGEDVVMRLQFDGKPVNPLPFVYRKEIGSFVRVEAGARGSVFQGIGLDVNLRLPLNQLLQYKDIVNMIE